MVLQHFGMKQFPLGKGSQELWDDGVLAHLAERFEWLLDSPGVGLLTGEAGVGKSAVLRQLTSSINPHRYKVIYLAETDFGRLDLYRGLAIELDLEPAYRRAQLWREIKARIEELTDGKQQQLVWIIDEAQNLPPEFFRDLPAFLNFAFDSRDLMTIWLVGHPELSRTLKRTLYAALSSRIQCHIQLQPVIERERFQALLEHAMQQAGCNHTLISDSGIELLRNASMGLPRHAGRIIKGSMQRAMKKGLNHLPDDLLQQTIEELQ
jgi:MSHA biogenesis protein MshM